jgi:hypothetical protein
MGFGVLMTVGGGGLLPMRFMLVLRSSPSGFCGLLMLLFPLLLLLILMLLL